MSHCIYRKRDSANLNTFITSNNLLDVPNSKYDFTWYGPSHKCSKLDRALLNQSVTAVLDWKLKGVGRKQSDHLCLLLYSSEPLNWGPKPCRPFNVWLEAPEVILLIQDAFMRSAETSIGLQEKLKLV